MVSGPPDRVVRGASPAAAPSKPAAGATAGDHRRKPVPTTCSSHRHRAPLPLRSAEDALATLALATDAGRETCVVIGGLDQRHRPLALLVVDGGTGGHLPLAVDVVIAAVRELGAGSPVAAVFLASSGAAAA